MDRHRHALRAVRCPYPECARVMIAVATRMALEPTRLCTPEASRRELWRRLVGDGVFALFAESILCAALAAAGYAFDHVMSGPKAESSVQHLAQAGIVAGAVGLGFPVAILAVIVIVNAMSNIRQHRETLARFSSALPSEGIRLGPCPKGYRAA